MSGTTIDNEWQQVMQRVTANENEWSSQLKFFFASNTIKLVNITRFER